MNESTPAAAAAGFRLSPQQRALWLPEAGCQALRGRCLVAVEGPLDAGLLRQVVLDVCGQAEILRTSFPRLAGMKHAVQVIAEQAAPRWDELDLRHAGAAEQPHLVAQLFDLEAAAAFDLERGPLARFTLIARGRDRHDLLCTLSALCADSRTLGNLAAALAAGYAARLEGRQPPPPAVQYADFAEWRNQLLTAEDEEAAAGRAHWHRLAAAPEGVLPVRRGATASGFDAAALGWLLEPRTARLVEQRAADGDTASFLLACWQVVLAAFSGQRDFLVALSVDGRRFEQLHGSLGPYSQPVPVRCEVRAELPFAALVREAATAVNAAGRHQEYFEPENLRAGWSWRLAGFELDDRGRGPFAAGPLRFTVERQRSVGAASVLKLCCRPRGDALELLLIYDRAALGAAGVAQLGDSLQSVVRAAAGDPGQTVGMLPLLGPAARHRTLFECNDTGGPQAELDAGPLPLFERSAAARPHAIALSYRDQAVSYGELNRRANRLAHRLRAMGVNCESRVAICLDRSPQAAVAVLAIWKAAGAYVAIDPELPPARQRLLLERSGATVLLVDSHGGFDAWNGRRASIDEPLAAQAEPPDAAPPATGFADSLAYVVFTSGSTGGPKGVMSVRRGVANYLRYLVSTFRLGAGERILQVPSLSFDAAVRDLVGPLTAGATVHLLPAADAKSPEAVVAALRRLQIDRLLSAVPSWLRAVTAAAAAAETGGSVLRQILVSGESLDAADCRAARRVFGAGLEVVNQYGPTECTMTSSFHRAAAAEGEAVPLGRPIPHARFYVLDEAMRPVPPGVFGELHIGGDGLARGYLDDPALTAERFVADPFSACGGERLYRTGDRVRWLPELDLEFGGRLDRQVKVRGVRIELGEVEAALRTHPQVREAAVLAEQEEAGTLRLVAYLVTADAPPDHAELRHFLAGQLPDSMLPNAFLRLDALPLTPNGKLDRRALPALGRPGLDGRRPHRAPATPTQEIVVGLCAEVLGQPRLGIDDNFFERGGHSLLAAQLLARLCQACGVQLPLQVVFEAPTLAELAARIDHALRAGAPPPPPIAPAARDRPLPLSFAQQRIWVLSRLEPDSPGYNMPLAVRVTGGLEIGALRRTLDLLVQRHEVLRTTIAERDGEPVQLVAAASRAAFALIDLAALPAAAREPEAVRLAQRESHAPFDLARGPWLRVRVLRLAARDHAMTLTLHHVAADDWSIGVLALEVGEIYRALLAGAAPRLPALAVQYADFASWQRERMRGEVLERHLAYWRAQLAGSPARLRLPADRPRPATQSYRGAVRSCDLPAPLTAAVQALGRRHGATLFMTLLAAFAALLGRYAAEEDVVVGTPVAGRNRVEVEPLIGCFINTLVMRVDLSADPSCTDLLKRVRRMTLAAQTHQELPFESLVAELRPDRDLGHSPLVQVMLTLLTAPPPELALPGLAIGEIAVEDRRLSFDLELLLQEGRQGLAGRLHYNPNLFDGVTVERLLRHFERWLGRLAGEPERRLSDVCTLSGAELQQLLRDWNDSAVAERDDDCFSRLFAAQAARAPAAVAVLDAERQTTYGELAAESRRWASLLAAAGARPETVVAVLVERGRELLAAMIGIFEVGGVYLPLDMQQPPARLAHLLAASGAAMVLAGEPAPAGLGAALAALPEDRRPRVLWLGDPRRRQPRQGRPQDAQRPAGLAYLLYTSGSSGLPKGAMVEHRGMLNHLLAKIRDLALTGRDVVAQTSPVTFDVSIWQFLAALLVGGRVWIPAGESMLDPRQLLGDVDRAGVTVLEVVPSQLRSLLGAAAAAPAPPPLGALRWLIATGEALPAEVCRSWWRLYPAVSLLNAYGPTECSDDVAHHPARPDEIAAAAAGVPIGRPVANLRLYVLDRWLQPVPIGARGEICAGGTGVGRGYLADPARTAEAFVPDPFADRPGCRLYRTGDSGRLLPGGAIDFLGRIDHQVKVRGVRIELREIEVALAGHPAVGQCAVLASEEAAGDARLVAYVVAGPPGLPPPAELRHFLAERLPAALVPSVFVALDSLPLTPHGKVDRQALPSPASPGSGGAPYDERPLSPAEELLIGYYGELLGNAAVTRHDDFFALGGHSLLAMQLISRVRGACGVELPLRELFDHSTPAALAVRVDGYLAGGGQPAPPALVPVPRDAPLALSFAQQRLWFLSQLDPDSPAYNVPHALLLEGELDAAILHRALVEIVRRHESLRTTFSAEDGAPRQRIAAARAVDLPRLDLAGLPAAARQRELSRLAAADALTPFDLGRGPLARVSLVALAPRRHVVLSCMHHIVSDGWSLEILWREMALLYAAHRRGEPSPLPPLPIQYADFAHWQRRWLRGDVLDAQLGFWRRYLARAPHQLPLPTDRPRRALAGEPSAGEHRFRLPAELGAAMRRQGSELGVTPFMTLLSAFMALLWRATAQDDLCIGSPVAGRNRLETEGLIGFFVNTLVLRGDLAGDPTWRTLLGRVREAALQAHAHQDLPFERLVEELAPERGLGRTPLVQAVFVLQHAARRAPALPGLEVGEPAVAEIRRPAKFDLLLAVGEDGDRFACSLTFSRALFDAATVRGLARRLAALLAAAAASADQPLATLALLAATERRQLLRTAARGLASEPGGELHRRFTAQAERSPEAVALVGDGLRLTYRELDRRANRLGRLLAGMGIGPESLVGLCVERSPDMIVAILGILKAGAAYVPLDPIHPPERLAAIVEDSAVAVVLSERALRERLSAAARVLLLDELGPALARQAPTDPCAPTVPDHAAYVIHTSGSTGRPKGVVVSHAGATRLFTATQDDFGFDARDVWTLFHSYSFDFSVWEIWGALLHGGALVVVPQAVSQSPHAFHDLLRRERVSVLNQTPAAFRQLAAVLPEAPDLALRLVIFGGEMLDLEILRPWFRRFAGGGPRLVNMFGITETTVHVTARTLTARDLDETAGSVLGGPIADLWIVALDRAGQPVPDGIAGELHVGGPGLARGYLGRPDLTAARFVPDGLRRDPGARLYRSGDLVRRGGGELRYLGRIDQQVKIRGFRVELGEIESALTAHPGVAAAACLCDTGAYGDQRLAAYVVAATAAPGERELRRWLRGRLPEHMVPESIVWLDTLPLTAHGKLDRRALANALPRQRPDAGWLPPRTLAEETLARMWADVLGLDRIGIESSFFELGGHSLSATRLLARLRHALGVELSLRELFAMPSVAAIAPLVEARLRGGQAPSASLSRRPGGGKAPLSFPQERHWLLSRIAPESPAYNVSKALRLRGRLDVRALAASLDAIVSRHEVLRTTFELAGETPVQVIAAAAPRPLPFVELRGLAPARREAAMLRLAESDALRPFALDRGPLLRVALVRLDAGEHVLLLCAHHIVCDAWSVSLLAEELGTFYAAATAGLPPALPELPIQYADFALWQRGMLADGTLAAQLEYWRQRLSGVQPLLELPADRPRPAAASHRTAACTVALAPDLVRRLDLLSRAEGCTLYMVLLAGFKALLAAYAGIEDVVVGSGIANRTRVETERSIGCFANLLALRTDLSGDPTLRQLLARVRDTALAAHAHQDLPFQTLLAALQLERDPSYPPLSQVLFELHNTPPASLSLAGLEVSAVAPDRGAGDFDLALFVEETAGRLVASLHYNVDLFLEATAGRLLGSYERLLAQAARDPDLALSRLAAPVRSEAPGAHGLAALFTGDLEAPAAETSPGLAAGEAAG